ncbi:hypothetical protein MB46_10430 [Arthrobacter alpinus]|uniref:hypothetical protein n=1 Tax=Arthrobacter alpinus TaxID=656366 RepID=UPI0005CAFFC5|nr:hypothetical protein [Arthrobacter alpinus]ALV45837.1 hypothetical protein MB46_10430 [Arthrobacter alpinus]
MTAFKGPGVRQIGAVGTTPKEHRLAIAGQYAENAPGVPRSGLLVPAATNVVTPTATTVPLTYNVAAVAAVIARTVDEGVYTPTTTGTTAVPTANAPASGSRWDLVWFKQNDQEKGDADNAAVLGVTSGVAGATPTRPTGSVPAGAIVIAEAQIFSGTATTTAAPNTVTQVFPITASRGAPIPVRSLAERATITATAPGLSVARLDLPGVPLETWDGTKWPVSDIPWTNLGMAQGFTPVIGSNWAGMRYRVKDGWFVASGAVQRASSWPVDQVFALIPAALRPGTRIQGSNCQFAFTDGNLSMDAAGSVARAVYIAWPLD